MCKAYRSKAEAGTHFVLFRGNDHIAGDAQRTRVYKSFTAPPNRAFLYVYHSFCNWKPQQHYFTMCKLVRPVHPPAAVLPFPYDVELVSRPLPIAPRYSRQET